MGKKNKKKTESLSTAAPKVSITNKDTFVKETIAKNAPTHSRMLAVVMSIVLFALSFLLNSNTFNHRFVLDDHGIIKSNKYTKTSLSWENTKRIFTTSHRAGDNSELENSIYRPVTKLLFNIQWNLFDANADSFKAAGNFHVVNVLLYAMLISLLFWVLYHAFNKRWVIPFFTTLLFAVHPIHAEVVANVKSADELLSFLGIVAAIRCAQLYIEKHQILYLVLGAIAYTLALFSKESTVVAVALFPLFIYYFSDNTLWKKNLIYSGLMLLLTLGFLGVRHQVLGQYPPPKNKLSALDNYMVLCAPENQAVLSLDLQEKYKGTSQFASAVKTLGFYLYTFVYPHPLSCDYSFSTLEPAKLNDLGFIASFVLFLAMFAFVVWRFKQKHAVGFAFLWFFMSMSITSNVFFLIGSSFGERFLFIPSLGLCLAVVYTLAHYFYKQEHDGSFVYSFGRAPLLFSFLLLLSAAYSYKTYARNEDWKTDYKLFSRDVEYFPNSTHLLFYIGNHLSSNERKDLLTYEMSKTGYTQTQIDDSVAKESAKSIYYFTKSLSIFPALPSDGYNQLGKAYFNFSERIKTGGNTPLYYSYLDSAIKYYLKAYSEDSTNGIFINNIGTVYYNRGMMMIQTNQIPEGTALLMESFPYFVRAHQKDTTESDFMNNIGCIYGTTNRPDSAIYWFEQALAKDSMDLTSIQFLDITWRNKGNIPTADYYKLMAENVRRKKAEQLSK